MEEAKRGRLIELLRVFTLDTMISFPTGAAAGVFTCAMTSSMIPVLGNSLEGEKETRTSPWRELDGRTTHSLNFSFPFRLVYFRPFYYHPKSRECVNTYI